MIAAKDFSARWNGRAYAYRKGQRVDAPRALVRILESSGLVRPARREKKDD